MVDSIRYAVEIELRNLDENDGKVEKHFLIANCRPLLAARTQRVLSTHMKPGHMPIGLSLPVGREPVAILSAADKSWEPWLTQRYRHLKSIEDEYYH